MYICSINKTPVVCFYTFYKILLSFHFKIVCLIHLNIENKFEVIYIDYSNTNNNKKMYDGQIFSKGYFDVNVIVRKISCDSLTRLDLSLTLPQDDAYTIALCCNHDTIITFLLF